MALARSAGPDIGEAFRAFCAAMTISSKEDGVVPLKLNKPQEVLVSAMTAALKRGIHNFVVLKARQLGISTVSLAIDLFWALYFPGMQAALVVDRDDNKEKFRAILSRFLTTLPAQWPAKVKAHNRNLLELENGSMLDYLTAGSQRSGDLGTSRALTMVHATEVAKWAGAAGVGSLQAALSQRNPARLRLWESSPNGFNHWRDMWLAAERDPGSVAIFLAWWMHDDYSIPKSDPRYKAFWDGTLDEEELRLCAAVKAQFNRIVSPSQLAWWRWSAEAWQGTVPIEQEYPWTPDEAFVGSGDAFFPARKTVEAEAAAAEAGAPYRGYGYLFSTRFEDTELVEADEPSRATLKIWEPPAPRGRYAVGVDPAYGRNDAGDLHSIIVLRCYADKAIQVASYATNVPDTYQLSWVLAHLAGLYRDCMVNLEIGGPGAAVMTALKALKNELRSGVQAPSSNTGGVADMLGNMRWYLYHRPDSMGSGYVLAWKTQVDTKSSVLLQMRDAFQLGQLEIRDPALLREMTRMVRIGTRIMADADSTDDRVMACSFALRCWIDWIRGPMLRQGRTFSEEHRGPPSKEELVSHIISEHFALARARASQAAYDDLDA